MSNKKYTLMEGEMGNLNNLLQTLPPIISRNKINLFLGGLISKGTLQNLDSEGKGPRRIKIGRKVGYLREDFVAWLKERMVIE